MVGAGEIKEELRKDPRAAGMTEQDLDQASKEIAANITLSDAVDYVKDDLGIIDGVFAVLGAITAFRVGSGQEEERKQAAMQSAPAAVPPGTAPSSPPPPAETPTTPTDRDPDPVG